MRGYESEGPDLDDEEVRCSDPAARLAVIATTVVLIGFAVDEVSLILALHEPAWQLGAVMLDFAALTGLQLVHSFPERGRASSRPWIRALHRHPYATLLAQAVLSLTPLLWYGAAWLGAVTFLAGSVLLMLPAVAAWPCWAGMVVGLNWWIYRDDPGSAVLQSVELLIGSFGVFGLSRAAALVAEVRRARATVARLAVVGERLRFARDLHELLGASLSAITLKCELVYRMLGSGSEAARQELTEVLRTSRQALTDVRAVARGYREMSLTGEAEAAESMLRAIGIRVSSRLAAGELPSETDSLLASVLREGLTNMLQHSETVSRCRIDARRTEAGRTVVFTLANDGVSGDLGIRPGTSTTGGLHTLASRLQQLGGRLRADVDAEGWFTLTASAPLCAEAEQAASGSVPGVRTDGAGAPRAPRSAPGAAAEPAPVGANGSVAGSVFGPAEPGVPAPRSAPGGEGTTALAAAAEALLPVPAGPAVGTPGPTGQDLVPRTAAGILMALILGYYIVDAYFLYNGSPGLGLRQLLVLETLLVPIAALQLLRCFPRWVPVLDQPPYRYVSLGLQAVLVFVPYLFFGAVWLGLPGFLIGSVLLLSSPRWSSWLFAGGTTALYGAVLLTLGLGPGDVAFYAISAVMCGIMVFGVSRMRQLVDELHRSRAEQARLMVMAERLRFARDLHDLMGLSLSTITLKCEVAYRLAADHPQRARQELTEILDVSRRALADVREVASGYREMSLKAELVDARAVLATAGIQADIRIDGGELPVGVDTVLATVLREALTNVLRHSKAERCTIGTVREGGTVVFTVANDGVVPSAAPSDPNGGSGIGNLASRVRAVGGTLDARLREDGWFQLSVRVDAAQDRVPVA